MTPNTIQRITVKKLTDKFTGADGPTHKRVMPFSKRDYYVPVGDARKLLGVTQKKWWRLWRRP